ncbi:zinc finger MYM-type protein 1-like [Saccostrea echinata]|uniref:zinc finger MYM-type protein 1-like n=1 Tax=Saccostrea echinata TaxID=191078 RepID=UPI002A82391B|nr:zinc finger MYM-type protein 1-like [Saccostrea echinata]
MSKTPETKPKSKQSNQTIDRFFSKVTKPVSTPDKSEQNTCIPDNDSGASTPSKESPPSCSSSTISASLPPYPDIATLDDSELLVKETKMKILTCQWENPHTFDFPARDFGNRRRRLSAKWLLDHPWLRYSIQDDALYCGPCVLFGRTECKEKLFINKVTDWSNLPGFIKRHLRENSPHYTYQTMAEEFIRIYSKDGDEEPILYKLSTFRKAQVSKNRHILKKIMEVLLLCGKQNIPIRGHVPERSNFIAILHSMAQGDEILAEHLSGNRKTLYTSSDIQNEIINLLANQIRTAIVADCNKSKCFALIADETTDTATREQLSVCLRYLVRDQVSNEISIKEDFLDFVMARSTKGEHLAELLIQTLQGAGIDIAKMRAQGYDGAANMSGKYSGVQARIRQVVPGALYVHCKSHCLNLAVVHSCSNKSIRSVMTTVQEIAFSFDYSSKKLQTFFDELEADEATKEKMEKRTKLRTLCETRWTSRADALFTFKTSFPVVVHALESLHDQGDDKAGQQVNAVTRFDFIIGLVVAEHVLQSTVHLSLFLQGVGCDLLEAVKECRVVVEMLGQEREDDSVWDELYQVALDLAAPLQVDESMPRRCGRQTGRANHPADTPRQYWRISLYYPFVDHVIMELDSRLLKSEDRFMAQHLLPIYLENITNEHIAAIYNAFQDDIILSLV